MTEQEQNLQRATEFVAFLNEAVAADRQAMDLLSKSWAFCNKKLADHPQVQVTSKYGRDAVRTVGILCGLSERMYGVKICIVTDEADNLIKFDILQP